MRISRFFSRWFLLSAFLFIALSTVARAADVVIGVPNWPSVKATAHVLKVVMQDNLGLKVELRDSTNPVIFEAMDKGDMHVHPEVWLPNQANLHNKYVKQRGTVSMNPNSVPGPQNICVSKFTADKHGVKSVYDLTDPEKAKLFDTNNDGKGEMWIGGAGWASTNIEKIRAKSYGYDDTMELLEIDESLAMARIDAAVTAKKPIVSYCYQPHHMYKLYDLVNLKEPPHDPNKWKVIQPTDNPDWLAKSSAEVAWPVANLHIHYASALQESAPEAAAMLANVKLEPQVLGDMIYALVVKKQNAASYAKKWVAKNSDTVESWLQ